MTPTLAIIMDAFRRLRSQKIFWIVLMLSGLMVGSFAMVGVDDRGVTILGFEIPGSQVSGNPEAFYKGVVFGEFGIQIWLSFLAIILALVSTAGILPDLLAEGAIDLVLSRPVTRLRVFLTVYASGLLFVSLQVIVFCVACFFVMGLRAGFWEPGVFLAVPLVVCLFSYLYCVCALLGLLTRSTIAALLLTILFWVCLFGVHITDITILEFSHEKQVQAAKLATRIKTLEAPSRVGAVNKNPQRLENLRKEHDQILKDLKTYSSVHRVVYGVKTVLPKTYETVMVMERVLMKVTDLPGGNRPWHLRTGREAVVIRFFQRPLWWVLGTSLAFELVVLAAGAVIFQRRDF